MRKIGDFVATMKCEIGGNEEKLGKESKIRCEGFWYNRC